MALGNIPCIVYITVHTDNHAYLFHLKCAFNCYRPGTFESVSKVSYASKLYIHYYLCNLRSQYISNAFSYTDVLHKV